MITKYKTLYRKNIAASIILNSLTSLTTTTGWDLKVKILWHGFVTVSVINHWNNPKK